MNLEDDQKFEALKLRYQDQSELAKFMKQNEQKLVFGFISVQFVLIGWFSKQQDSIELAVYISLILVNLIATTAATVMLTDYKRRRHEVINTIKNICNVFRFNESGYYSDGIRINPEPPKLTIWAYWYMLLVWLSFFAASVVISARYF